MAQHVLPCQTFSPLRNGPRHAGQKFTLGLISRLSLQVGHLARMSLMLLSLPMAGKSASWKYLASEYRTWGKTSKEMPPSQEPTFRAENEGGLAKAVENGRHPERQ